MAEERRLRRHPGRRRALAAILGAALLGQACTGDDTDDRDDPSPEAPSSGNELSPYQDDGGSVLRPDDARLEVVVPEDWTFEIGATWVDALAPDDVMRVRSSANPVEDDVMDALAASAVDAGRSVEPAVIAGAREALRFDFPGDDDDPPTVSFAAITDDGQTLVTLTLMGETSDLPSGTRESIIDSLRIGDAVSTSEVDEDR